MVIKKAELEAVAVKPESAMRMPTVRELMNQFNVSLATVNRALSELENDGVIVRRQGSGIVAAGKHRTVARLQGKAAGVCNLLFAYNDYPDESTWKMVHTIAHYSRLQGCNMVDCKIYPDTSTESLIEFVKAQSDCSGLILLVGADRMDAERLEALGSLPMTIVVVDSMYFYANYLPDNVYILSPDAVNCAEKTVEVLLRKGHRRIGFAGGCLAELPRDSFLREEAFRACQRNGLCDSDPALLFNGETCVPQPTVDERYCELEGERSFRYFMALPQPPTAIVAYNSLVGISILREARRSGVEIPRDLSVIGLDYLELINFTDPTLSVVDHVLTEMGRAGTEMLIDLIEQKLSAPALRCFMPVYRPGKTVASPRTAGEE